VWVIDVRRSRKLIAQGIITAKHQKFQQMCEKYFETMKKEIDAFIKD
jgi:hypothetical protein